MLLLTSVLTAFLQASGRIQAPAHFPNPQQDALDALDRIKPPIQFDVYAARSGDDLQVAIEVPADAVAAGRWKDGADLMALAEDADGQGVGSAEGKLSPSGHALLRIPLEPGSRVRRVAVRLHAADEVLVEGAPVPERTTLVGDPLVYVRGRKATADPIAILSFSRRHTIRMEWPVLAPLSACAVRLLDRDGRAVKSLQSIDRTDPRRVSLVWKIPRLKAGDYLIELIAGGSGANERKLLAVRVR